VIEPEVDDQEDRVLLWLGGDFHEISDPEQMVERLQPYADLTGALIDRLRYDKANSPPASRRPSDVV